jgi:hypothetical protein
MIESENIVVAIGVCSALADKAYDVNKPEQSKRWEALRSAIYYLVESVEEVAKAEVTYE